MGVYCKVYLGILIGIGGTLLLECIVRVSLPVLASPV